MSAMLPILCVILTLSVTTTTVRAGLKCDAVRPYFESQGFPATDIPKEAISCKFLFEFFPFNITNFNFEYVEIMIHSKLTTIFKDGATVGNLKIAT